MHRKREFFKKSERLKSKLLFGRLFKEGKYFKGANFYLRFLPNDINITRLGISLQKKAFPKASSRNKIKRLIREVFRKNKQGLIKGYDLAVSPKKGGLLNLKYNDFEKELLGLFRLVGVLNNR